MDLKWDLALYGRGLESGIFDTIINATNKRHAARYYFERKKLDMSMSS